MSELCITSQDNIFSENFVTSQILNKFALVTLKDVRSISVSHRNQVDDYLLKYVKYNKYKELTLSDLDNVPIIAFYQLLHVRKNLTKVIPLLTKRNCFPLCQWLSDDDIIAKNISNEAVKNGHLYIIQYIYDRKEILPDSICVGNILVDIRSVDDNISDNKLKILIWCIEHNIKPCSHAVNHICKYNKMDLIILLEEYKILPTHVGADDAIKNEHFNLFKYLYSRNIEPDIQGINFIANIGNLEMLSWLDSRNLRINQYGLRQALSKGHLNIIKYFYKQNVSFKDDLLEIYTNDDEDDEDDEEDDEDDENIEIIDWLNSQEGIVLFVPETLNLTCTGAYELYSGKGDKKDIQEKHIKILKWLEKHLNLIPNKSCVIKAILYGALDVLKYLLSKNIFKIEDFLDEFDELTYVNHAEVVKFLYQECKIVLPLNFIPSAISHGKMDIVDAILEVNMNTKLDKLDFELIKNNIYDNKLIIKNNVVEHAIGEYRKRYLNIESKILDIKSIENYTIYNVESERKEVDIRVNSNVESEMTSMYERKDNTIVEFERKEVDIKLLIDLIREEWYRNNLQHYLVDINRAISNNILNVFEWADKNNIPFDNSTANICLTDKLINTLKILYKRNILPDINFDTFGNIIRYNHVNVLKFLIRKNIIKLTERQSFTREQILININGAAASGYLDVLKYLHELTIIDSNGNRLNTLPNNIGLSNAILSRKLKMANWILDKVFMMIEIEKLCTGKLSNSGESKQFFIDSTGIELSMDRGYLKLIKRCAGVNFDIENPDLNHNINQENSVQKYNIMQNININFAKNNLNILKWLDDMNIQPTPQDLNNVRFMTSVDTLRYYANELDGNYIRYKEKILHTQEGVNNMVRYSKHELLEWSCRRGIFPDITTVNNAVVNGKVDTLNLLYKFGIVPDINKISEADRQDLSPPMLHWLEVNFLL